MLSHAVFSGFHYKQFIAIPSQLFSIVNTLFIISIIYYLNTNRSFLPKDSNFPLLFTFIANFHYFIFITTKNHNLAWPSTYTAVAAAYRLRLLT